MTDTEIRHTDRTDHETTTRRPSPRSPDAERRGSRRVFAVVVALAVVIVLGVAVILTATDRSDDGAQTADALRQIEPELPVIFISGHSQEQLARTVALKPRSRHITKPFRTDDLAQMIEELIEAS